MTFIIKAQFKAGLCDFSEISFTLEAGDVNAAMYAAHVSLRQLGLTGYTLSAFVQHLD